MKLLRIDWLIVRPNIGVLMVKYAGGRTFIKQYKTSTGNFWTKKEWVKLVFNEQGYPQRIIRL